MQSTTKKKVGAREKTRNITLAWKHRDTFEVSYYKMGKPHGGNKVLALDANKIYSVKEIENQAVSLFKNELNAQYFEKTIVGIGTADGTRIFDFTTERGEGLWNYSKKICDSAHRITLYLLTTYLPNTSSSNSSKVAHASNIGKASDSKDVPTVLKSIENEENANEKIVKVSHNSINFSKSTKHRKIDDLAVQSNFHLLSTRKNPQKVPDKMDKPDKSNRATSTSTLLKKMPDCKDIFVKPKCVQSTNQETLIRSNKLTIDDIRTMKIPLITEIPFENLEFTDEILGKGSFGVVTKGRWIGTNIAIKSMELYVSDPKYIIREVALLRHAPHENIVTIMGVSKSANQFHIIMELVLGNSLRDILFTDNIKKKFNLKLYDRNVIGKQICTTITFLHIDG